MIPGRLAGPTSGSTAVPARRRIAARRSRRPAGGFGLRVSSFGIRDSGSGFIISGFGIRVQGLQFRASGFGFRIYNFGFGVAGFWFRVPEEAGVPFRGLNLRAPEGPSFRISGVRVAGFGFQVRGFGYKFSGVQVKFYGFQVFLGGVREQSFGLLVPG